MIEASLIEKINQLAIEPISIMEVCGTHTHEIARSGITEILSDSISIISGPGCPVCVTSLGFIDAAIQIAQKNAVLVTFGDMVRLMGSNYSMQSLMLEGYNIHILYSVRDIINIAIDNKEQQIVFCGVGFETTAPVIASVIKEADLLKLTNLTFLLSLKRMDPILRKVLDDKNRHINGVILPGHVATITGSDYFRFISEEYNITSVICGFEVIDIVGGIYYLVKNHHKGSFLNLYSRAVSNEGNKKALALINEVFDICDEYWRGIGEVKDSGFVLKEKFKHLDALDRFNIKINNQEIDTNCLCKDVIMGYSIPTDCKLFKTVCNPSNPIGPCMTSNEGTCLAYYKYRGKDGKN